MSQPDPEVLERLSRLQADPNLRHTAARWRAHEACYPGRGALERAAEYEQSDRELAERIEKLLGELREQTPDAQEIGYLEWVLGELRGETT